MQTMTNCETKSVAVIDRESLFQGGPNHRFDSMYINIGRKLNIKNCW